MSLTIICQHSFGWWYQLSSAFGGLRQSHEVAWRPQLMLESLLRSTEILAWLNLFSCSCNHSASSSHKAFNMGLLHMVSISKVDRLSSWRVSVPKSKGSKEDEAEVVSPLKVQRMELAKCQCPLYSIGNFKLQTVLRD